MPKLILFAPCEKIVVDQIDNTTSLISLLEALQVADIPDIERDKIPDDASIPVNWSLLALWQSEIGDDQKLFDTRFNLQVGGRIVELKGAPFKFEDGKPNFRNVLRVVGLPLKPLLGEISECTIHAFIRSSDTDPWDEVGIFPIIVKRPEA
jgi:hypothetical protein